VLRFCLADLAKIVSLQTSPRAASVESGVERHQAYTRRGKTGEEFRADYPPTIVCMDTEEEWTQLRFSGSRAVQRRAAGCLDDNMTPMDRCRTSLIPVVRGSVGRS
jgi:hypothetical protein